LIHVPVYILQIPLRTMSGTLRAQAVVKFGAPLEVITRPIPSLKPDEVLIKTTYAGMCHSELHLWEGKFDLGAGHSIPVNNKFPHTLGHEIEGTVVACGSNVPKDLFTRDKSYAVFPWLGCEKDTCVHCHTKDTYNLCEVRGEASKKFVDGRSLYGGYASHSVVPHWRYLIDYEGALPKGLGCVYMCSGLTAFSGLKKLQRHPGIVGASDVLIIGLGGLGFQALGLALPMLGGTPLCADIRDEPLSVCRERGCKTYIMTDANSIKAIRAGSFDGTGIGGVIDFVGNADTANFAEAILRKGGKHVICGLFGGMIQKPVIMFPLKARAIEGSFVGSYEEAKEMMEVLRGGKTTLPPHHFQSIMTASQSLLDLRDRKIVGRRIFVHDWPEAKV